MPGPGEYRPDPTEGITRVEDLPQPKVSIRSRNYRRRPCPRCGHSAYRDRTARRTLHDLGNTLTGRPRDVVVLHSQHYCTRCRKYFNADMTDLADPGRWEGYGEYRQLSETPALRTASPVPPRRPISNSGAVRPNPDSSCRS